MGEASQWAPSALIIEAVQGEQLKATQGDLTVRLHRIEGQVRGIERMLEEERPCEEVLVQLLAVRTAIDRVTSALVASRTEECLSSQQPDSALRSVKRMVELLLRST
ncbi:MAG: metal-sensitive transcriptional regulator [Dehalococcoidia bacterium]|nr:metal-sensitive transcriptional regulator [Dehalococcoidia bacterium]